MRSIWAITRREILAYFVSPIAYAFMTMFLLVVGIRFYAGVREYMATPAMLLDQIGATIRTSLVGGRAGFATVSHLAMMLSLPGLSMRLLSEERKQGTAELLFTSPITSAQIVLGKYFGTVAIYLLILVGTLPMFAWLGWVAEPEWGALFATYLGLFLHGCMLLAIGLFASSFTENQFVALVLTYAIVVPIYLLERVSNLLGPPFDLALSAFAATKGLRVAGRGAVDSHYVFLWIAYVFVFLFLSGRVLDSKRWR